MTNSDNRDKFRELSLDEHNLLSLVREIEFGELLEVNIAHANPTIKTPVSAAELRLINLIRNGEQHFTKIAIHQGCPVLAETTGERHKIKYRKKFKLN